VRSVHAPSVARITPRAHTGIITQGVVSDSRRAQRTWRLTHGVGQSVIVVAHDPLHLATKSCRTQQQHGVAGTMTGPGHLLGDDSFARSTTKATVLGFEKDPRPHGVEMAPSSY